jgi:hypothetical protein
MTELEMNEVVNKVIEKVLLRMPEVIANLIEEQAMANKLNKQFYGSNPEFKDNLPLVTSVIEQIESDHVNLTYDKVLEKAAPIIKDRLRISQECDIKSVPTLESLDLDASSIKVNGEL